MLTNSYKILILFLFLGIFYSCKNKLLDNNTKYNVHYEKVKQEQDYLQEAIKIVRNEIAKNYDNDTILEKDSIKNNLDILSWERNNLILFIDTIILELKSFALNVENNKNKQYYFIPEKIEDNTNFSTEYFNLKDIETVKSSKANKLRLKLKNYCKLIKTISTRFNKCQYFDYSEIIPVSYNPDYPVEEYWEIGYFYNKPLGEVIITLVDFQNDVLSAELDLLNEYLLIVIKERINKNVL